MIGKKKFDSLIRLGPKRNYVVRNPDLRKKAQVKGGIIVSKDVKHMQNIGRLGGKNGGGPHRKPGTPWVHHGLILRRRKND